MQLLPHSFARDVNAAAWRTMSGEARELATTAIKNSMLTGVNVGRYAGTGNGRPHPQIEAIRTSSNPHLVHRTDNNPSRVAAPRLVRRRNSAAISISPKAATMASQQAMNRRYGPRL